MPVKKKVGKRYFGTTKHYVNNKGAVVGKGVWIDEYGEFILPGSVKNEKETRSVLQYNSDGTVTKYPYRDWTLKKALEHEYRVLKNDRKYAIPYIPSKAMTITIDKRSPTRNTAGATFSENVLDSIAINAQRAGLPFSTALGMAAQESTIGQGRRGVGRSMLPWDRMLHVDEKRGTWGATPKMKEMQEDYSKKGKSINYDGVYSPTLLISNWKQRDESPVHAYYYNAKGTLLETPKSDDFYKEDINATRVNANKYRLKSESPLEHGFRKYKEAPAKYNGNDKGYPKKVNARAQELTKYSPEIRAYMKKHNLHGEGGDLNQIKQWDDLSLTEKSDVMASAIRNGMTTLQEIRQKWNEFAEGGYMPSKAIKDRITTWEGDSMKTNRSFEAEAKDFNKVIPQPIRKALNQEQLDALYSYGYNVGMGNLKKRVLPALTDYVKGNIGAEDVASNMWAGKDSLLKGLAKRRETEKNQFVSNAPLERQQSIVDKAIQMDLSNLPKTSAFDTPLLGPVVNPTTTVLSSYPTRGAIKPQDVPVFMEVQDNRNYLLNTLMQNYMADTREEVPIEQPQEPRGLFTVSSYGQGGHLFDDGGIKVHEFTWDRPLTYQGRQYPTRNVVIDGEQRTAFTDGTGRVYTLEGDRAVPAEYVHRLPEVKVRPQDNVLTGNIQNDLSAFDVTPRYGIQSNDVTAPTDGRPYNEPLKWQGLQGAREQALWEQEHPNLASWGYAAGAAPYAIAAWPFAAGLSEAAAGTATGQGLTNILNMAATTARNSTWLPWADAAISTPFVAYGVNETVHGNFTPESALEVMPLAQVFRPLTLFSRVRNTSNIPAKSVSQFERGTSSVTDGSLNVQDAAEQGRQAFLNYVQSPWYRQRWLNQGYSEKDVDRIIGNISYRAKHVPFDFSKTSEELKALGTTDANSPAPPFNLSTKNGSIPVINEDTGMKGISIGSDIADARNTAFHELLHYTTNSAKGFVQGPALKQGKDLFGNSFYDFSSSTTNPEILIPRGKNWQNLLIDQNKATLPLEDSAFDIVRRDPAAAQIILRRNGYTAEEADRIINQIQYQLDIQEQRAHLQTWFYEQILPNIKNPNDASEIEQFFIDNSDILNKVPAYVKETMQTYRPGSIKDYAKYFAEALSSLPFISTINNGATEGSEQR